MCIIKWCVPLDILFFVFIHLCASARIVYDHFYDGPPTHQARNKRARTFGATNVCDSFKLPQWKLGEDKKKQTGEKKFYSFWNGHLVDLCLQIYIMYVSHGWKVDEVGILWVIWNGMDSSCFTLSQIDCVFVMKC